LGFGFKGLFFCRNNDWLMETWTRDSLPKWVLMKCPKIPQIVCSSPKVGVFDEKRLHWASVVCDQFHSVAWSLAGRWRGLRRDRTSMAIMSPRWIMGQVESTRFIIPRVANILIAYSKLCVDHVIYYGALQIIVMFFTQKTCKNENNNPWFNILLHTQLIVCAPQ
jgi:hypothetical protein